MAKQSKQLTKFYRAYRKWIRKGAPENHKFFSREFGLCKGAEEWDDAKQTDLQSEIHDQFYNVGLDGNYPFNTIKQFNKETLKKISHKNAKRLAWVNAHCKRKPKHNFKEMKL